MATTSRAVVTSGDGTFEIRELTLQGPPPDGGVLRVEAVGLCHSDIDNMHHIVHTPWGGAFPTVLGHEIVGRIEELTPAARAAWGVKEGDRVAVRAPVATAQGTRVYGHDFGLDERSGLWGGCGEYMELLAETKVERLPDDSPAEELTIWEPLSIAMGWAGPIAQGDTVAILGPGHLGLAAIVAAQAHGAGRVFITGTAADGIRLAAARDLGVEAAINVNDDDPVQVVQDLTGGGVDVVIDAASASTVTVIQAMQMVRRGGTVVIGGLKDRRPVEGFISDWIPMRRITINAGSDGDHVQSAVQLLWKGGVPTKKLVGEVFDIDGVGEAFDLLDRKLEGRDAIRVGLRFATP